MNKTPFNTLLEETIDEIAVLEKDFDQRSNAGLDNHDVLARLMELRNRRDWLNEIKERGKKNGG